MVALWVYELMKERTVYKSSFNIRDLNLNKNNYLGIDLGLNNFTTCTNNQGLSPFVINGKIIKSIEPFIPHQYESLAPYDRARVSPEKYQEYVDCPDSFVEIVEDELVKYHPE